MVSKMTKKEKFERYEKVRQSGKYNMIMESVRAAASAGLSLDDYFYVLENYSSLSDLYGE